MREAVRLEHQKYDDDGSDRDLAQEGDVGLQTQCVIDRAAGEHCRDPFHRFRQQDDKSGAHQGTHDGAESADDDHGQKQDRALDAEPFIRHHELIMRIECAADAGEESRDTERECAVFGQVDAHDLGGEIMIAHRDQCAAIARPHHVGHQQEADDHIGEHDVEKLPVALQCVAEDRERLRHRRHGAAGKPLGAREEVEQDILRGECGDGEIKSFQTCGRQAEHQTDDGCHQTRKRDREESRDAYFSRQIRRRERAEQEECGVTNRNLPGEAHQHVEPERGDAIDADLDQQAQPVFIEEKWRGAGQQDAGDGEVPARHRGEDSGVRGVGGAEVPGGDH